MSSLRAGRSAAGLGVLTLVASAGIAAPGDWPTIGGDPGGMRFAPATQITPANVARLKPAWTYHMKPEGAVVTAPNFGERAQAAAEQAGPAAGPPVAPANPAAAQPAGAGVPRPPSGARFAASESIPLVVGGVMYLATPYSRIVALDAATGKERWIHELPKGVQPATRGMEYWPGDGSAPAALIFGTNDGKMRSVRAADGKPSSAFGTGGVVELRTPDVMVTGPGKPYSLTSPPIVYRHLVITGSAVGEAIGGAVGDVRAWDAVTGKLVWTLHSRPSAGEPGYDSWANDSGHNRSGVNVWGLMTVDAKRGIVYLPFGAPANDRVGVDRPGNNLFSSSIVAADAASGKIKWHFQIVHHDIWDNDAEAPPTLFDVRSKGRVIPAVGIVSKNGMMFILDRVTGKPIYPVVERPVPASDVPGEQTSPTQPFPAVTEPLSRMRLTPDELSTVTPEHAAFCRRLVDDNKLAMGGPYNPPPFNRPGVYFPGTIGGVNWGGGAYDPKLGLFVVNAFTLGQIMQIVPDGKGGFTNRGPLNGRFWDPKTRLPCQAGPWGQLVAVNVHNGKVAWRSTLGLSENLPAGKQATGRPSTGGPIVTGGGVSFIAGTDDSRFRAFDTRSGRELWTYKLPASAHTNPVAYSLGAKQYVGIVSTGGSFVGSPVESDQLTVFTLP